MNTGDTAFMMICAALSCDKTMRYDLGWCHIFLITDVSAILADRGEYF